MKKTTKTLATIIMLSAMVGFMGCTTSLGEDEKTPTVPVQPAEPDKPTTPGEQEKPGKQDGQGTEGTTPGGTTTPEGSGDSESSTNPDKEGNPPTEDPNKDNQEGSENNGNPGVDEKPGSSTESGNQQTVTPVYPKKDSTRILNNKPFDIVTFGQWPQTIKDDSVIIDETEPTTYMGWECYKGNDDAYYVKRETKVTNHYPENGPVKNGTRYFKIEPIKWRVLTDDYSGKKLLFAENALDVVSFDNASNNYKDSSIRTFLNGDFYDKAFSEGEKAAIATTIVDNTNESTIGRGQEPNIENKTLCDNTEDKVFLLSLSEMTTEAYGFNEYNGNVDDKEINASRKIPASHYTIATGTWVEKVEPFEHCCYWLRSPIMTKKNIYETDQDGKIIEDEKGNKKVKKVVDAYSAQLIGEDGRNGTSEVGDTFPVVPALTVSQLSN